LNWYLTIVEHIQILVNKKTSGCIFNLLWPTHSKCFSPKGPGVDCINMFTSSSRRSKKYKKTVKSIMSFALLGSACAKAARKMLVKSTPGWRDRFSICYYCKDILAVVIFCYDLWNGLSLWALQRSEINKGCHPHDNV